MKCPECGLEQEAKLEPQLKTIVLAEHDDPLTDEECPGSGATVGTMSSDY